MSDNVKKLGKFRFHVDRGRVAIPSQKFDLSTAQKAVVLHLLQNPETHFSKEDIGRIADVERPIEFIVRLKEKLNKNGQAPMLYSTKQGYILSMSKQEERPGINSVGRVKNEKPASQIDVQKAFHISGRFYISEDPDNHFAYKVKSPVVENIWQASASTRALTDNEIKFLKLLKDRATRAMPLKLTWQDAGKAIFGNADSRNQVTNMVAVLRKKLCPENKDMITIHNQSGAGAGYYIEYEEPPTAHTP